jgi:hypothetical protein
MIQRETLVVCVKGSRDFRCGLSASACALSRRTKARGRQTDRSSSRLRVYRMKRKALLITSLVCSRGHDYAFVLFFAAQRAFIISDNFFLAAGLMGRRAATFLVGVLICFGADLSRHLAHRCFMAAEIRLRAAALIVRRFTPFGGRPRLGADVVSPSRVEMAWSRRLRSALNSETMLWMSIKSSTVRQAPHIVAVMP